MSAGLSTDLRERRTLGRPDYALVFAMVLLSALGLLMIFSASAPRLEADELSRTGDAIRQSVFVIGGMGVFALAGFISDRNWRMASPYIYSAAMLLLLVVLSPLGAERNEAQRWIPLGIMDFQPSEFAKPAVILALAMLLSMGEQTRMTWAKIARASALVVAPSILIWLQPDLGTMLVFGFVATVMLFVAGTSIRQLLLMLLGLIIAMLAVFQMDLLQDYQERRIISFLNPNEQSLTDNYHQNQSQIAISLGGLFGQGLFEGTQTNLAFVPAQTTDFIFTAVAEQLGFVGAIIVLGLFLLVVWRLLVIAVSARDRFGMLVTTGVAAMFGFHVFVNIGMAVGLLPVTGLPLPLMSFGGSFYGAMTLSLGISHAIWMRRSPVPGERHLLL
jgi:rod shape determining protein RodA